MVIPNHDASLANVAVLRTSWPPNFTIGANYTLLFLDFQKLLQRFLVFWDVSWVALPGKEKRKEVQNGQKENQVDEECFPGFGFGEVYCLGPTIKRRKPRKE